MDGWGGKGKGGFAKKVGRGSGGILMMQVGRAMW